MTALRTERWIDAPAEEVWALVIDLDASQQALRGIDRIELVSGPYPVIGVGTTWDETRTLMRRTATTRLTCTAIDHDAMATTVESEAHGAHHVSELAVHREGEERCRVTMTVAAEPLTLVARVVAATIGRLAAGATKRALQADLDDIARALR